MSRLAALVLLGSALGVSARHGHLHAKQRNVEAKRDGQVITATIDGAVVSWTMSGDYYDPTPVANVNVDVAAAATTSAATTLITSTSVAAATSTAAAAATATASSSSSSSSSGLTSYVSFEDNCSSTSSKRATVAEIAQVGNTGTEDGAYGCNYILVATEEVAEQYDNYAEFYGATEDMTCYYWNKIAKDGSIAGWYTSTDSYFSFDVSSIMAQTAGGTVNGVEACTLDESTCSSISAGAASVINAFDEALAAADGYGYNTGGTLKFKINLGF